jgi:hypothetical protein
VCSECGREFDPADPRTTLAAPHGRASRVARQIPRWITPVIAGGMLIFAANVAYFIFSAHAASAANVGSADEVDALDIAMAIHLVIVALLSTSVVLPQRIRPFAFTWTLRATAVSLVALGVTWTTDSAAGAGTLWFDDYAFFGILLFQPLFIIPASIAVMTVIPPRGRSLIAAPAFVLGLVILTTCFFGGLWMVDPEGFLRHLELLAWAGWVASPLILMPALASMVAMITPSVSLRITILGLVVYVASVSLTDWPFRRITFPKYRVELDRIAAEIRSGARPVPTGPLSVGPLRFREVDVWDSTAGSSAGTVSFTTEQGWQLQQYPSSVSSLPDWPYRLDGPWYWWEYGD